MIGNYVILIDGSPKSALNKVVNRMVGWEPIEKALIWAPEGTQKGFQVLNWLGTEQKLYCISKNYKFQEFYM